MNKCDFCTESRLKDGRLVCPHYFCFLSHAKIMEILKQLAKIEKR